MKTVFAKTNPAFKRAQPLPLILDLLPPTASAASRNCSECNPPPSGLRPPMTELAVCAGRASQGVGLSGNAGGPGFRGMAALIRAPAKASLTRKTHSLSAT